MRASFVIMMFYLQFTSCNNYKVQDIKKIEGMWEIKSISTKGEVFYPKGNTPLVDFYSFNTDSTGIKKKLRPNYDKTFSSSLDKINFEIIEINGLIYLNYISRENNWRERIIKLTSNELIIYNNKFEYNYIRFKKNK